MTGGDGSARYVGRHRDPQAGQATGWDPAEAGADPFEDWDPAEVLARRGSGETSGEDPAEPGAWDAADAPPDAPAEDPAEPGAGDVTRQDRPLRDPGRIRGRRTARLAADRHRRRNRWRAVALASAVAVVVAAAGVLAWTIRDSDPESAPEAEAPVAGRDTRALLLVRHGEDGGPARSLTLLAAGPDGGPALVLFLPVGTLVDIPGVGMDRLGLAHQYGAAPLVQATVENVLGVVVDHTATVSDQGLGAFLDRLGGLGVNVPARLVDWQDDGSAQVRFEPGEQFLDGPRLAEYWGFRGRGEDELDMLPRQQRVLEGMIAAAADDEVRAGLVGDGAPQLDTAAEAAWLEDLVARLADARAQERLRFALLPVEPFGGQGPDGGATYRIREQALAELVDGVVAATVARDDGDIMRVQVLNGVGVPGIGQEVDRRLDRGRFRIVVTDNARSFDFTETQILVYEETPEMIAAAERVRQMLGVGSIQVSRQPQSVVDLTIVVGADFQDAAAPTPQPGATP